MKRSSTCKAHPCGAYHQDLVLGYRLARHAQETRCEDVAMGYPEETSIYYRDVEAALTFKDWLIGNRMVTA